MKTQTKISYQSIMNDQKLLPLSTFKSNKFSKYNIFPHAQILPQFFQTNLQSQGRIVKYLKGKQGPLRGFYYQLFKLTFQIQHNIDYCCRLKNIIFDHTLGNNSTSPISGKQYNINQYKRIIGQFIKNMQVQVIPNFQLTFNLYPIIDQAMLTILQLLIDRIQCQKSIQKRNMILNMYSVTYNTISDNKNNNNNGIAHNKIYKNSSKFGKKLQIGEILQNLCIIFSINLQLYEKCYSFQQSDVFLYIESEQACYLAFLSQMAEVQSHQRTSQSPVQEQMDQFTSNQNIQHNITNSPHSNNNSPKHNKQDYDIYLSANAKNSRNKIIHRSMTLNNNNSFGYGIIQQKNKKNQLGYGKYQGQMTKLSDSNINIYNNQCVKPYQNFYTQVYVQSPAKQIQQQILHNNVFQDQLQLPNNSNNKIKYPQIQSNYMIKSKKLQSYIIQNKQQQTKQKYKDKNIMQQNNNKISSFQQNQYKYTNQYQNQSNATQTHPKSKQIDKKLKRSIKQVHTYKTINDYIPQSKNSKIDANYNNNLVVNNDYMLDRGYYQNRSNMRKSNQREKQKQKQKQKNCYRDINRLFQYDNNRHNTSSKQQIKRHKSTVKVNNITYQYQFKSHKYPNHSSTLDKTPHNSISNYSNSNSFNVNSNNLYFNQSKIDSKNLISINLTENGIQYKQKQKQKFYQKQDNVQFFTPKTITIASQNSKKNNLFDNNMVLQTQKKINDIRLPVSFNKNYNDTDDSLGTFYRQFSNTKVMQAMIQPYKAKVRATRQKFKGIRSKNFKGFN